MAVSLSAVGANPKAFFTEYNLSACGEASERSYRRHISFALVKRYALKIAVSKTAEKSNASCRNVRGRYAVRYRACHKRTSVQLAAAVTAKVCIIVIPSSALFTYHNSQHPFTLYDNSIAKKMLIIPATPDENRTLAFSVRQLHRLRPNLYLKRGQRIGNAGRKSHTCFFG